MVFPGRDRAVFCDLRHGDTAFLEEGPCLCGEGPFAAIEQEEPLTIGCAACRLFADDEPVGKTRICGFTVNSRGLSVRTIL